MSDKKIIISYILSFFKVKENKNYFYLFIPFFLIITISFALYRNRFHKEYFNPQESTLFVAVMNTIIISALLAFFNFLIGSLIIQSSKRVQNKKNKSLIIAGAISFLLFLPYLFFNLLLFIQKPFFSGEELIFFFSGETLGVVYFVHICLNIFFIYVYGQRPIPSVKYFHFFENKVNKKVLLEDVIYFMAEKNKIFIQTKDEYFTTNNTLKKIINSVGYSFIQINKNSIINLNYVHSFFSDRNDSNKYKCILKINEDTEEVTIGRKWLKKFKDHYNEKMSIVS